MDPKLTHHRTGPGFVVEKEREEIRRGVKNFIRDASSDPKAAKGGRSS